ncbi:hypothetical protein GDI3140 [Gluconacetobacter diazotrophicus PA1 5]|uniref:Uncharacterized protein n=1 Tax=Gluconacetobacter diazotrophicus (strain ATCC 49037 / DSM 5601 / CCUG 37298 / CIP 103539 / LMG 7603 / PAl5) TaxID=272568 RepID=A9H067_GLUDA|nr:hypothetical protein GDI3140 [Gluconacetobacter diazotrophicus PA1 5]
MRIPLNDPTPPWFSCRPGCGKVSVAGQFTLAPGMEVLLI